jgi:cytochrome c peroxidase
MYRTTPLRGIWSHAKGGYYHDGRFSDLAAVVKHYDSCFGLNLSAGQQHDLVEYLKSL